MLFNFNTTKSLRKKIQPELLLLPKYQEYSQEQLQAETKHFKKLLSESSNVEKTLKQIRPEAFAVVREAAVRVRGELMYEEQLMGGYVLSEGDIAEMKTGEGKSLTGLLPVYLEALVGKGVHVVTVNEYLAQRDAQNIGSVLEYLGLSVGVNLANMSPDEKRKAYACDITYSTNSELGFDYLRDNMVQDSRYRVQRGLHFALIDEVDSILIDDARTPLIISGLEDNGVKYYKDADKFVKSLKNNVGYTVDERTRTCSLTEDGMLSAMHFWHLTDSLYSPENANLLHFITNSLFANYVLTKDVDYLIKNRDVYIIDQGTGRIMEGRQWSNGIHQAVEAKENCPIKAENVTVATITYQNFFRLYDKLAGMTGTAKTEEEELLEIYNMRVIEIPTHKPVIRKDMPDEIYGTKRAKYNAIIEEVKEKHATGQPILIGTPSVEVSEIISDLLRKARLPHVVLNAKDDTKEADIITNAGQKNAITVATNMAGRGTDIKLGEGVKELGGLYVIGSERHESRRIDNQLRGRSGRQGDPGMSKFFISTQDNIITRFGSEHLEDYFKSFGDEKIVSKQMERAIETAQKRIEGLNYDARKNLLKYDDVMGNQRETIYEQRNYILDHDNVHDMALGLIRKAIASCIVTKNNGKTIDKEQTLDNFQTLMIYGKDGGNSDKDSAVERYYSEIKKTYESTMEQYVNTNIIEKEALLTFLDQSWSRHIDAMDKLKQGIGLRGYVQNDPLQAYVNESYELFDEMTLEIAKHFTIWAVNTPFNPSRLALRDKQISDEKEG